MNDIVVLKFGGTSVASAENWLRIRDLVLERLSEGLRPVVVHSALAGVSNRLVELIDGAVAGDATDTIDEIAATHYELGRELGIDAAPVIEERLGELRKLVAGIRLIREVSPRLHAKVLAQGELMATALGAAWLESQGIDVRWHDARVLLEASEQPGLGERAGYLSAVCDFSYDPDLVERLDGDVVLTQGFIASNSDGNTVLLGRGGSDTSAAYLAAKLSASRLEIWTDVPGMFSADPKRVSGTRVLSSLHYIEAQEIASTGGNVLHPRCIPPVRRAEIPLWIKCTPRPSLAGTLISADPGDDSPRVKAISHRSDVVLVSMETLGMWHEVGFLAEAFRCFGDLGLSVDLVSTSEANVTVTIDAAADQVSAALLGELERRLSQICRVTILEDLSVVSLVGRKIRANLHEIGPALEAFQEHRIHLISQSASDLNLSFVVGSGQAQLLIQRLHALLVQRTESDSVFGPTWDELVGDIDAPATRPQNWWTAKRDALLSVANDIDPAYVYDRETIESTGERLLAMRNVSRVFYAVKANNNPEVLRTVEKLGLSFECVSPGEIGHVMNLFPDLEPQRILFTPNFAPRDDYRYGLRAGVWVTLDNIFTLRQWAADFRGQEVFLRLDTGQGRGHHEHVRTAGVHSKFGIPLFELDEVRELAQENDVSIVGLHAHTGSGILTSDNWRAVAAGLAEAAAGFPDVRYIDLGGGLGIPEKPGQLPLDLAAVDDSLDLIRQTWPQFELWLEPGRYLVAEAGVLLARVTQTKGKGNVRYVGISTGMNSLLRPALYGAYHEIANLSRLDQPGSQTVSVVGPNCETGDRLGSDRLLPPSEEGDVLLIANTGAYGHVMSSRYNLREPATEVVL